MLSHKGDLKILEQTAGGSEELEIAALQFLKNNFNNEANSLPLESFHSMSEGDIALVRALLIHMGLVELASDDKSFLLTQAGVEKLQEMEGGEAETAQGKSNPVADFNARFIKKFKKISEEVKRGERRENFLRDFVDGNTALSPKAQDLMRKVTLENDAFPDDLDIIVEVAEDSREGRVVVRFNNRRELFFYLAL